MKKYFFASFGLLLSIGLPAQVALYKTSLAPSGGSVSNGSVQMIYTAGENFVREADVSSTHLSEGFIGPDLAAIMGVENYAPLEGVHIYPNPVKDYLHIGFDSQAHYVVRLYDLSGKLIMEHQTDDRNLQLDLRALPAGLYMLGITAPGQKRFTAVKIRKL